MLAKTRVVYLFMYVNDLADSERFYKDGLGLRVIEQDSDSVKFDAGQVILALNRASDYGIKLPKNRDNSADIVFLVDDIDRMKASLELRGVDTFMPTEWYQPGGIADFYDLDGHWLTLYQPSEEAMSWPSGERILSVMKARGRSPDRLGSPSLRYGPSGASGRADLGLDGSELIYVFLFVTDADKTTAFYYKGLGLRDLEGGPCSRGFTSDEDGVIKYDTGGVLLTTHHIVEERDAHEAEDHWCPPRQLELDAMKTVAPVFHVEDIEGVLEGLSERCAGFSAKLSRSQIGAVASFTDPSGHLFFLYEPSAHALRLPSGRKLSEILATPLSPA